MFQYWLVIPDVLKGIFSSSEVNIPTIQSERRYFNCKQITFTLIIFSSNFHISKISAFNQAFYDENIQ